MRSTRLRGWWWRGGVVILAVGLGLMAFESGVRVSDREVQSADLATHTYYTLGLFVFGGLDLGVPVGGPMAARLMLWAAYFLAPLITVGAVLETAVRVISPEIVRRRLLRGHAVVVGFGRIGSTFLEALRAREPRARALVLDRDPNAANLEVARERFGATVLAGDVRTEATLDSLVLERARLVALVTDDDLVNLEVAWRLVETAPHLTVLCHVADLGMRRLVGETEAALPNLHVFNSHEIAARRLYREHLVHHFRATGPQDVVVLAGFGRFGQTIFEYLARETEGEVQRAVVVDRDAHRQRRLFEAQVKGLEAFEIACIQGDLDDPKIWDAVDEAAAGLDVEPVYVIGTDDDQRNLRTAIALRRLRPDAAIFVRCVFPSAFTSRLADDLRFTVLGVDAMLRQALREQIERWLDRTE